MEKLVISIVTWNSRDVISACVKSVLNQTYKDFRVIIVDNNSKDGTGELLESFRDSRITVHKMTENRGFCGGHNFSINHSNSEFVMLVNPDIIMNPDYVEKALVVMQKDANAGTVCGLLLQSDPGDPECRIDSAGLDMKRSRIMQMKHHNQKVSECNLVTEEVFGADGALPLYRRSMIDEISIQRQFFDEMFFAHKEDWDVSWRSHIYGWKTIFSPECVAIHPRHFKPKNLKLRNTISDHIKIHGVKNQLILLLKNETLGSFLTNGIFIVSRQLMILFYILLYERSSLKAYSFVSQNYKAIMANRKIIQRARVK